jgi:hypothetical protein
MLLQKFIYMGLAATAVSAVPMAASTSDSLARRDLPTVQGAFDKVGAAIDKLIDAVNSFDGDNNKLTALLETSEAISKMNLEGAELVKKSPIMGLGDAIAIMNPTSVIREKVDKVMNAFVSKKELLEKAGVGSVVLDQMIAQRKAADELAAAILANLPMQWLVGPIATPIAATITDALNSGITKWGGTPPPPPGEFSRYPNQLY